MRDTHFYIRYRANGIARKEMVGTQLRNGMTAYKVSIIRSQRIQEAIEKPKNRRQKTNSKNKDQTFDSLFEEYLKYRMIKSSHQDTFRYQNHIHKDFGKKTPESIDFEEFKEFRERISVNRKPATVRNILELMRRISNFGVRYQMTKGLSFPLEMP